MTNSLAGTITFTNTAPYLANGLAGSIVFTDARQLPPVGVSTPDFGVKRTAVFHNKTVQMGQNEQRTPLESAMTWRFTIRWSVLTELERALLLDQFCRCRGKGKPFVFVNPEDDLQYICRHTVDEQDYDLFAAGLSELKEITIIEVDEEAV